MSELILPDRRLEQPSLFYPGRKPVGNVKIDWSHPLAKGCVVCIVGGKFPEVVSMSRIDRTSNIEVGRNYFYNTSDTAGGNAKLNFITSETQDQRSELTWVFVTDFNMVTTNGPKVLCTEGSSVGLGIGYRTSPNRLSMFLVDGSSEEIQFSKVFTTEETDNLTHCIAMTYKGNVDCKLAMDGNVLETIANTTNYIPSVSSTLALLGSDSTTNPVGPYSWRGALYLAIRFNRALSDEELKTITHNPYQFLIPA